MKEIDFTKVNEVFIDAVTSEAEDRNVKPEEIALILFPFDRRGDKKYRTRVKIFSMTKAFETETVRLKKLTVFDIMGHISKAIMQIFKGEVYDHNQRLESKSGESTRNYPHPIDYDKIECYVQLSEDKTVVMTMTYDQKFLRNYDMQEEFGDADLDEIEKDL